MTKRANVTLLIAEYDNDVREAMCQAMRDDGYVTLAADNARSTLRLARQSRPDVIILDIELPDSPGFELCPRIRALPYVNDTPILFTGTREDAEYVAQALDCGGDDYLCKPFAMNELSARVRALVRRTARRRFQPQATLHLDEENLSVMIDGRRVALTPTEFNLLGHLCDNPTEHHTANSLLETLWQYPPGGGDTALVRNHIRNLRRKIEEDPDYPSIIISMHGRGYTINARVVNRN